ncbi:MAG: HAMP domain-containing histidine kinase [Clostridiales bacterium]|nr:HAMP domain-containing histidine kinase [Clostridiales bacterium]
MNPYLIAICVLGLIVAALVVYIVVDKIRRKKELDELIEFLTKVQDRDTFPDLGLEAEGRMLILRSEIYKLASTLQEQYAGEVKKNTYMADMLSNISHQIKTPLTAINLMTDALKNGNLDEAQRRRCIANITAQTDHITWLVRSLLTLAEIDAGVLVLKKESVPVKDMIGDIVSAIAVEADIKDVAIEVNVPAENVISCDRRWTSEAFSNIIKNSLQHTEAGGTIKISSEETNLSVNIRIEDNGCGISKKDLPNIFNRFYHGEKSDPNSNGIGLSLAKQIINSQNGTISCESEEGRGTIFEIKIYKSATV